MTEFGELRTSPLWDHPGFLDGIQALHDQAMRRPIDTAPLVRGWSGCDDCGKWITDGDLCGHCERTHVRRVVERHGTESAGVCGPCATEAATTAARTGGDVGHLYDDALRRKAGLPVTCEPEKAGALDVELCDEPVKPADPAWKLPDWPDTSTWWGLSVDDLIYEPPLRDAIQRDMEASMMRHPAGSKPRDVDEELETIKAVRLSIACLLGYPRGPGSAALLHTFDRRLEQLEAAALAKRGDQ